MPPPITPAISTISHEDYPAIQGVSDFTQPLLIGVGILGSSTNGIGVVGDSGSDVYAGVFGHNTKGGRVSTAGAEANQHPELSVKIKPQARGFWANLQVLMASGYKLKIPAAARVSMHKVHLLDGSREV